MKPTNLIQEAANDTEVAIGGGPPRAASPEERAQVAKERVMAVYRSGVVPSYSAFISKRGDGTVCACVIGTLAFKLGSEILSQKHVKEAEAEGDYSVRMALTNQVCQATSEFSLGEVFALEEGFMGWGHGRFSRTQADLEGTRPFYEVGRQIAKETQPQV